MGDLDELLSFFNRPGVAEALLNCSADDADADGVALKDQLRDVLDKLLDDPIYLHIINCTDEILLDCLEDFAIVLCLALAHLNSPTPRSQWVDQILQQRDTSGLYSTLFPLLIKNEKLGGSRYTLAKFIRVDKTVFDELLSILKEDLKPNDPVRRDFLSAEHKLVVTLRYLATGESYESLQYGFRSK